MTTELPDVNVLVALLQPNHVGHELAMEWFDSVDSYATTPVTELGLVRVAMNSRVMGRKIEPEAARASLQSLRADPRARFVEDATSLAELKIDVRGLAGHRQVTDLHLMNLVAHHGVLLVTFDRGLAAALMPVWRSLGGCAGRASSELLGLASALLGL